MFQLTWDLVPGILLCLFHMNNIKEYGTLISSSLLYFNVKNFKINFQNIFNCWWFLQFNDFCAFVIICTKNFILILLFILMFSYLLVSTHLQTLYFLFSMKMNVKYSNMLKLLYFIFKFYFTYIQIISF